MTTKQLPFLPGYTFDLQPKTSFHKSQRFAVQNGTRLVDIDRSAEKVVNMQASAITFDKFGTAESPNPKEAISNTTFSGKNPPSWIANDRQVLSFNGYYTESVDFSPVESSRVRKIVLNYHLEDDTLSLVEPKQDNSGLVSGTVLKRHKFPKDGVAGAFLKPEDLKVGAELTIYSRKYKLVDCNGFTRVWYNNKLSVAQPQAISYPVDAFQQKEAAKIRSKPPNHTEEHAAVLATQKFFQNDGKVLRFYCVWDDKESNERRTYTVRYYLADDTVDVNESNQVNSGRDTLTTLLKRNKLPKDFTHCVASVAAIGRMNQTGVESYTMDDFKLGGKIIVFGRDLLIVDCDPFTKQWYIENRGKSEQDFVPLHMPKPVKVLPKMAIPPYNGYGTEEDSLGSFYQLVPKQPKKDITKILALDGKNLRFLAKFQHASVDDLNRRFLVTFYMADDTVAIFEKQEKDTGFPAGKFLERCKVKNPKTTQNFQPNDFHVGGLVTINCFPFELLSADEYTLSFMEEHPEIFAVANPDKVCEELKADGLDADKLEDLIAAFKAADLNGNGTIDKEEFRQCLAKNGLRLNEHQLITLLRKYDSNHDGVIDFVEFASAFRNKFA